MNETGPRPSHEEVEAHFREIIASAELAEPDEVRYFRDPDEVWFIWSEEKFVAIVELDDDGPAGATEAAKAAMSALH